MSDAFFKLGADRPIARIGFGSMSLPAWPAGRQPDRDTAIAVLRKTVDLGVNHIDTAAFYARAGVRANELIRAALHPYPDDLLLATKVGPRFDTDGVTPLAPAGPTELRAEVQRNLTELGTDHIGLVNLRLGGVDGLWDGPVAESFAALAELRAEGLIGHLGLSNVTASVLAEAQRVAPVASVQNLYNIASRSDDPLVDSCAEQGIGYVPFCPLGGLFDPSLLSHEVLGTVAARHGCGPAQVALAWLLARSPSILLIPGTANPAHLEQNLAARNLRLSEQDMTELASIGGTS
ncbi:aryl-alcohol dehydrogenase-like predicted oxidoreductase [Tamaricihabitans halophyticus]|uniref:Aryl-alcohol dehydrogenase-like predicted oxidoreductase n=1 Tax=Tamaricihabitans halophyticus TaxID=1262583 RepID=A0A4V2SU31_9PSEU|nr:oxidoreductase [Tamaricihabitans halophyticus]TCP52976.1 aryl-alcohol dehydrogenase-like predicted oxidoreductase [Tamaricihabitans halophyticus]